jgi:hypothetical protein
MESAFSVFRFQADTFTHGGITTTARKEARLGSRRASLDFQLCGFLYQQNNLTDPPVKMLTTIQFPGLFARMSTLLVSATPS